MLLTCQCAIVIYVAREFTFLPIVMPIFVIAAAIVAATVNAVLSTMLVKSSRGRHAILVARVLHLNGQ